MADDLSLLLKIKGDAAGAQKAAADTRAAIAGLRTQLGSDFGAIQNAGQQVFSSLSDSLNSVVGQRLPLLGGAFLHVGDHLRNLGGETTKGGAQLAKFDKTLSGLSETTGKSKAELASFLSTFLTLPNATERGIAGYIAFGSKFDELNPKLQQAAGEMAAVAANTQSLGTSLTSAVPIIGIATAAIAALVIGAISLSKQFLDLTLATAEWQDKLDDLSQQTNVSVETLSALQALAEDTGGSIESVAQSLVIFQQKLEEAQDLTTKAGEQFLKLGISTRNTEEAFRDALKALAAMSDTFHQTNEAAELFGRRGGKQILAILKETHGDIDATIEKLRKLDSLVTKEMAATASKLNNQLNATQRQFRGLQAQIVNESMPLIIKALQDLTRILQQNRETFILLGQAIGLFLQGNLRLVAPAVELASRAFEGHRRAILPLIEAYSRLAAVMQIVTNSVPNIDPNAIPAVTNRGILPLPDQPVDLGLSSGIFRKKKPKGAKAKRSTELDDAIREAQLTEREIVQRLDADIAENKRALEEQARDIEEFTRRAIELAEQRHAAAIDRINAEQEALDRALAKKLISQKEYAVKDRELALENEEAIREKDDAIWELQQKRDRQIAEAELNAHKRSAQLAEEASERMIAIIRDRIERVEIAESEGEKQIAAIEAQGFERRKKLLEDELTRLNTSLERKKEINDELIRLDGERADSAERAARRVADAQTAERSQRPRRVSDATRERREELEPMPDQLSIWDETLGAIEERMESFHEASQMYVVGAFHNMADAATSAIEAWILYGGSLGKALKQALAAELAAISARAMVQAALHAAYAIGSLAFGNFAAAGQHAIAAAKFLAVAALTGVAARGLAGGSSFQQSAGGGASRGGGSTSESRQPPSVTDVNRRANAQPVVVIHLHGDIATPALNTRVVNAVVESLDLNDERLTGKIQGAAKRIG